MQQGEYNSPYYHYPTLPTSNTNPHPPDQAAPYASAPPFSTTGYTPSDYAASYSSYPPYPQNQDPAPAPTAPSYAAPPNPIPNLPPPTYNPPIQQHLPPSSLPLFDSHTAYQPPAQQQSQPYYSAPPASYDQPPQVPPAYAAPISGSSNVNPNTIAGPSPNSPYSSIYNSSAPYNPTAYESSYSNSLKYDHGGSGYFDDKYGNYGQSQSRLSSDAYGKQPKASLYDSGRDDSHGDGVYAYQGGKVEPYGARGTAPKSSTWSGSAFDDYGRSISLPSVKETSSVSSPKIVRAVPKADTEQDVKSGVQKFRVKLLPDGGSSTMDVLCQIGLDGIKMLDPSTARTLRIYPLETITRCEVTDSSTLSFWSKSSVDIEPRRIRLQSSSYTTNTLLDIVTAATVQVKEMGGQIKPPDTSNINEQAEKKKGFGDWMNKIKPANEEKDHWVPDEAVTKCTSCGSDFNAFVRKHHCRNCGDIFCDKCTNGRIALTAEENAPIVRVCDRCLAEVTQRLSNAKEAANKPAVQSHEDLARKLQEEMEKNRRSASGSRSEGSGRRMRAVACPTCTVHLQVQVPASGSETIECGVCQHPFLVSSH